MPPKATSEAHGRDLERGLHRPERHLYSITVRPSALAVLRLIGKLELGGGTTGRSAAFST